MNDEEFARAFEACEIPNESFRHRDHIRLAWIYLKTYGSSEAATRISASIRKYAAHNGASHKYHETVTLAWMRLVANAMRQLPTDASFEAVIAVDSKLLDKTSLAGFYSDTVLASDAARNGWVDPDLKPLP
jgi:hypothetical protein